MHQRRLAFGALAACVAAFVASSVVAQDVQRGGTLRMALAVGVGALDPLWGDAPTSDRYTYNLLYETLLVIDENGPQPLLATGWTIGADRKSVTFKLREGVKFHDGTPFNADAVKFNFERHKTSPEALNASDMQIIDRVDVLDPLTVRVNMTSPSGAIMSTLGSESGMIVSPTALRKDGEAFKRNPVGTGPFMYSSWKNDVIDVVRFPDYWRKGIDGKPLPYLDGVTVRVLANSSIKIVEAQSGNIDLADSVQVREFPKIEESSNLVLMDNPQFIHQWICFNTARAPFNDENLRKAVAHALDREAMARVVAGKHGLVTPTLVPPNWWVFDESVKGYGRDLAKAKEYLEKSGFKGELSFAIIKRDPDTQIAQIIQAQLKEIGIKVNIQVLERQAWTELVLKKKSHEMAMLRINLPRPDPDHLFGKTFGRNAGANWSQAQDEALFNAIQKGVDLFDVKDRKPFYVEAQKILLDKAYYAFLFHRPLKDVGSKKLHGVKTEPFGPFILTEAWLSR